MVDYIFAFLCSLSILVTVSASVTIASSNEDVCIGENLIFLCSVNGTVLRWNYEGSSALYSTSSSMNPRPLDIFQADFISICNGILSSNASVNVSSDSVANTLSGTTIFCDDPSSTDASSNYTININVKESMNISFLDVQLISERNIIKLDWGGAQCAPHYIIEVNDSFVSMTTESSYDYMIPPNDGRLIFTVHGVSYTGNVFTYTSKTLTRPICTATPILADNGTVFIMIKSENSSQLPFTLCYVIFNSEGDNCSEANRVIGFSDVAPGKYNYSVVVGNAIASTVCNNDPDLVIVNPSTTSGFILYTSTIIGSPCTTVEPQSELPAYALPVIIVLAILLFVAILIITVLLYITCKLRSQDKNIKRVNTTNLRTKSPDEKETASL